MYVLIDYKVLIILRSERISILQMLGSAGGLIGKKFHFNSYLTKALADAILVEWSIKWREGDSY